MELILKMTLEKRADCSHGMVQVNGKTPLGSGGFLLKGECTADHCHEKDIVINGNYKEVSEGIYVKRY